MNRLFDKLHQDNTLLETLKNLYQYNNLVVTSHFKGSSLALMLSLLSKYYKILYVSLGHSESSALSSDLELFDIEPTVFTSSSSMLYGSSHLINSRSSGYLHLDNKINIIGLREFLRYTPSPQYLKDFSLYLQKGQSFKSDDVLSKLGQMGYIRSDRVADKGEFALRGEVLDVFMPARDNPVRIVLSFDEIEHIKEFDVETQMSLTSLNSLTIAPCFELAFTEDEIANLCQKWNSQADFKGKDLPTHDFITSKHFNNDFIGYYFDKKYTIKDFLGDDVLLVMGQMQSLEGMAIGYHKESLEQYKNVIRSGVQVPSPDYIITDLDYIKNLFSKRLELKTLKDESVGQDIIPIEASRSFFGNINFFKEEIATLIKAGYQIIIFCEGSTQQQRLETLFNIAQIIYVSSSLSEGFVLPSYKIVAIAEHEIFGRRKKEASYVKSNLPTKAIDSFVSLTPGDFVVHVNYGVGKFLEISRIKFRDTEKDYISILYADDDKISVPIEQVNLIQRFIGNSGDDPRLDRIGSKGWSVRKARAKKSADDLAEYLVKLYAKRQEAVGFAYPKDDTFQLEFEADFPYTETADQLTCMEQIKADMEQTRPMDRLVCGDVGYGKTELAMRSAFKSAIAGKQVVILAPTTILSDQHYSNFIKRFERFPFIKIALLNRFVHTKKAKQIISDLADGKVDILIGTHRVLSKDIVCKNLGLLIVDEEQRFGVKDKEKIKNIKSNLDCLSLSATPIPRTLHMSLIKIRDLSMLTTAPSNRRAVETFVDEYNADVVTNAISKELERGGQVFYLHNRVESLEATASYIRSLVPQAMVEFAHGQMDADELDDVMYRFVHGSFSVLVSTTIVESGIDIPNVNTIIIDRADMYGLSQLYQLRGRVGRSDKEAYAYLFYPSKAGLNEQAIKRLQVLSDYTELGSGFKIAMKDMEIRGAGNLLGREQSGEIQAVGFDLYLQMIDQAVKEKMSNNEEIESDLILELEYSGFIPDSYLSDTMSKMELYKKIASVGTTDELLSLYAETEDRFGPLLDEVASLFSLADLRILCKKMKITNIKEFNGQCMIEFGHLALLNVDNIMRLIKESAGQVCLNPKNPASIIISSAKIGLKEKTEYLKEQLSRLI